MFYNSLFTCTSNKQIYMLIFPKLLGQTIKKAVTERTDSVSDKNISNKFIIIPYLYFQVSPVQWYLHAGFCQITMAYKPLSRALRGKNYQGIMNRMQCMQTTESEREQNTTNTSYLKFFWVCIHWVHTVLPLVHIPLLLL